MAEGNKIALEKWVIKVRAYYPLLQQERFLNKYPRIETVAGFIEETLYSWKNARTHALMDGIYRGLTIEAFKKSAIPLFEERNIRDLGEYLELINKNDPEMIQYYEDALSVLIKL